MRFYSIKKRNMTIQIAETRVVQKNASSFLSIHSVAAENVQLFGVCC